MRFHTVSFFILFLLLTSSSYSSSMGIDVLSETHHIYGWAGDNSAEGVSVGYNITSKHPLHYRTDGIYYFDPYYDQAVAESWAGDFNLKTYSERWEAGAYAESTYIFQPEFSSLILGVTAQDDSTHESPTIWYSLTNLSSREQLIYDIYNIYHHEDWENYVLNHSEHYSLSVNPENTYELQMFVYGWGGDNTATTSLDVTISSRMHPVPEPTTIILFGTGIVGLFGAMLRKKKKYY